MEYCVFVTVLAVVATWAASSPVSLMDRCPESVVHLEFGRSGVIPCNFQAPLVTWGNGTLNADGAKVPLISLFDYSDKSGGGYESGEYDILQNGSLVINSVEIHHQMTFEAVARRENPSETVIKCSVDVQIYVRSEPDYPMLNGHNQQYIEMEARRKDVLNCTIAKIRPAVTLQIVAHNIDHQGLSFQNSSVTLDNGDGTFNVSLSVEYEVVSTSLEQLILTCRVSEPHLFPKETQAKINLPPAPPTPVVENCNGTNGVCVVSLNETGTLSCMVNGLLSSDLRLIWEVLEGRTGLEMNRGMVTTTSCVAGGCNTKITSTCSMVGENITLVRCSLVSTENKALVSSRVAYLRYQERECVEQPEDEGVLRYAVIVLIIVIVFLVVLIVVVLLACLIPNIRKSDKYPKKNQDHSPHGDTQQSGEPLDETPLNGVDEQNGGENQQQSIP